MSRNKQPTSDAPSQAQNLSIGRHNSRQSRYPRQNVSTSEKIVRAGTGPSRPPFASSSQHAHSSPPISYNYNYRDALVVGRQDGKVGQQGAPVHQEHAYGATSRTTGDQSIQQLQANVGQETSHPPRKYALNIIPFAGKIFGYPISLFNMLWNRDRAPLHEQPAQGRSQVDASVHGTTDHQNYNHAKSRIVELERQLSKSNKDLAKAQNTARLWEAQCAMSEKEYQNKCLAYQRLLDEKERVSAENIQLSTEKQEYAKRLDRLAVVVENKQLYVGPQESDHKITEHFEGLFRKVKEFSFLFLSEHQLSYKELEDGDFQDILGGLSLGVKPRLEDTYYDLLAVKKTRRLLVQSIIGYELCCFVFRQLSDEPGAVKRPVLNHLSPHNASAIDVIEETLWRGKSEITARELHDWRALTLTLVSRAEAEIPEMNTVVQTEGTQRREIIVKKTMEWISEWAKPQEDRGELADQLGCILEAAVELSLLLRKQRAWWFVKFPTSAVPGGDVEYDSSTMEDIDRREQEGEGDVGVSGPRRGRRPVSLIVFPGLHKRGDTYGENYESEICVVKARVKCIGSSLVKDKGPVRDSGDLAMQHTTSTPPLPQI